MMLARLYTLAMWAMQPFVRVKLKRRALIEPLYGAHIEERFGQYPRVDAQSARPLVWIHAVSLGETRAAAILLGELRRALPTMRLLLTNGTATGRAEGAKLLQSGDIQVWQPWDTAAATTAFMAHFKPTIGLLMETELWPNLIASARAAHVPMALVNARLSEKSLKKSQRWSVKKLASLSYQSLAAVYAQTKDDAARLTLAGAKVDGVFGNLKFDITPNSDQLADAALMRATLAKPVIVFASSREGEESEFLNALKALPEAIRASAYWLIVPRHPQRFDEVAGLIAEAGFDVVRHSDFPARTEPVEVLGFDKLSPNGVAGERGAGYSIWLGDTLGEMAFYYGLSSAALLGGSFEPLGGQNLIEALACGCPVVMGPHTFNFEEAASLAALSSVAFRVDGLASAIQQGLALSAPNGFNKNVAYRFVAEHSGAAAKTAAAIQRLLDAATTLPTAR
jgi:3-deoxy-D-manno-octulosonic-acid transferase